MILLQAQGVGASRPGRALFDDVSLAVSSGDRLGLVGINGTGKSTLLRVLAGRAEPESGSVRRGRGTRVVMLDQADDLPAGTVHEAVAPGSHPEREWEVDAILDRLGIAALAQVGTDRLSGGQAKRVALARALVEVGPGGGPDDDSVLLILDEPTNHLDIDAIEWLQGLLVAWRGALVFVSHDRAFIDGVATRIVELDRARLRSYPGSFAAYEATKARELEDEALANVRADKLLAQEEVWVRQGVEARRTRSVGRVGRLLKLREQRAARRNVLGQVRLELDAGLPPGKIIAELKHVSMHFGEMVLIEDFSATILRGDKVGLIGPNGCGKTTLLKLILGELQPTRGSVRQGTRLQVAYFDQMRAALDLDATLGDTISPGSEWIEIGQPPKVTRKHVMSYLGDFLFAPERARAPVRTLSGGERNRLLLARLFALPANVLVLDEPTNDLDIDTLELLEELLQSYDGTVFLVSHDRRFLDNVVTSTIAWEGDPAWGGRPGLWREYEGGYEDWKRQRERTRVAVTAQAAAQASRPVATAAPPRPAAARTKLSYKEQRELEALPGRIEALEAEQKTLFERLAGSAVYTDEPHLVAGLQARHDAIEAELMAALERWEELAAR